MDNIISGWDEHVHPSNTGTHTNAMGRGHTLFSPILEAAENLYIEAQAAAKAEASELRELIEQAEQRIQQLEIDLDASQSTRDYLEEELNQERESRILSEQRQQATQTKLNDIEIQAHEERGTLEATITTLKKEHEESFQAVKSVLERKVHEQKLEITHLSAEKENLLRQRNELEEEQAATIDELQHSKNKVRALESEMLAIQYTLKDRSNQLKESENHLEKARAELTYLKTQSTSLEEENKSMKEELFDSWMDHKPEHLAIEDALARPASLSSLLSFPLKDDN